MLALIFAPSARGNPFEKRKSKKVKSENEELKSTESPQIGYIQATDVLQWSRSGRVARSQLESNLKATDLPQISHRCAIVVAKLAGNFTIQQKDCRSSLFVVQVKKFQATMSLVSVFQELEQEPQARETLKLLEQHLGAPKTLSTNAKLATRVSVYSSPTWCYACRLT